MDLKHTPLHQLFLSRGARMVPFAGWEMPIQFSGLIKEHEAVREKAGLFDISHMGVLHIEGNNPKDVLQSLVPSDLQRIGPGEACYTVLLNESGGIIDDLIVYDIGENKEGKEELLLIINSETTKSDTDWLKHHMEPKDIRVSDAKQNNVLIACQGPSSQEILESILEKSLMNLPRFGHCILKTDKLNNDKVVDIFIARTGYTGEEGFELLLPSKEGKIIWEKLEERGAKPCGLGARDTLRLEAAMHLYGHEMDSKTTPFEAGLGWLVHLEMPTDFFGRKVLEKQAQDGVDKVLVGLKLQSRAIAREGYKVINNNQVIGKVTSGTWSPTLSEAIALAYVPPSLKKIGTLLEIEVRGKNHPAIVVKKPFYRRS